MESRKIDLARELLSAGDLAQAESLLSGSAASPAQSADVALVMAELLFRRGKPQSAVDCLRRFVEDEACADRLRDYFVGERQNDDALQLIKMRPFRENPSSLTDASVVAQLSGRIDEAAALSRSALARSPENPSVLNQLARCLFNARKEGESLTALQRAVELDPQSPEIWHNLGHVLRAHRKFEAAESAFRRAVELAPAYRSALLNLGVTRLAIGRNQEALVPLVRLCEISPLNIEAWMNRGLASHAWRDLDAARDCYLKVLDIDAQHLGALRQLGVLYNELLDAEQALACFQRALRIAPKDFDLLAEVASLHERANRLDEARAVLTEGLTCSPGDPSLNFEMAKIERRQGNLQDCLRRLQHLPLERLHPRLHGAYWFELGSALDQHGDIDAAYESFTRGNALVAKGPRASSVDRGAFDRHMDAVMSWLAAGAPAAQADSDEDLGDGLCFLVGFPRSGTTLLDVMLDRHPGTCSIEERPTVERVAFMLDAEFGGYPFAMRGVSREARTKLKAKYRELVATESAGKDDGRLVIDKMPIRTVHAAFVARLFPKAKFIFALRHPLDVVLSNFMQHFAINEVFVHFTSIEESVRVYDRVMAIWQKTVDVLPIDVHYVRYEELVTATESTVRAVCGHLGLKWRDEMGGHTGDLAERGPIRTSSYHQVAEPVYRRALGRWEKYDRYLRPHFAVMSKHAQYFGYPPVGD